MRAGGAPTRSSGGGDRRPSGGERSGRLGARLPPDTYDRLTGKERYRLVLLALQRGDAREAERVIASRPPVPARVFDPEFNAMKRATEDMVLTFSSPWAHFVGFLEAFDLIIRADATGLAELLAQGPGGASLHQSLVRAGRDRALGELRALLAALEEVCSEQGLPGTFLLELRAPSVFASLAKHQPEIAAQPLDAEKAKPWAEYLRQVLADQNPSTTSSPGAALDPGEPGGSG